MNLVSIKKKLINQVSKILITSFVVLIIAVTAINLYVANSNLEKSEQHIRGALAAKANLLVNNNGQALIGMAEDYAFTSVKDLVVSTVEDDPDIIYGVFVDMDATAWVVAGDTYAPDRLIEGEELTDEISEWASSIESTSYNTLSLEGTEVLEYAAPVLADGEILGVIRYGVSTRNMEASLASAAQASKRSAIYTTILLALLAISAIFFAVIFVRRMAVQMTKPLDVLTQSAEVISSGNYDSEISVDSNDEIGLLAQNFESMRLTIRKKIDDLAVLNACSEKLARAQQTTQAFEDVFQALSTHFNSQTIWALTLNDNVLSVEQAIENLDDGIHSNDLSLLSTLNSPPLQKATVVNLDALSLDSPILSSLALLIPVESEGEQGKFVMVVSNTLPVHLDQGDIDFCESLSRSLAISLKKIHMREVIEEQNRTLEQKVEARTAQLQEKTNDIMSMMQNMHQGLFTVTRNRLVHKEYAAYCETIFETTSIAQKDVSELLFSESNLGSNVLDQVNTALDALLGEDEMMWDFNAHLLVSECEVSLGSGTNKILELEWDPIVLDDEIDKIMVTVRDVTDLRALQAEADKQKHELEIIGQILSLSEQDFASFIHSAGNYITECRKLIEVTADKDLDVVATLFRNMHTIKGNARTYGFSYITDSVHEAETHYDELRKDESSVWCAKRLSSDLDRVEKDIQSYKTIASQKLGRSTQISEQAVEVGFDRARVQSVLAGWKDIELSTLPDSVKPCFIDSYRFLAELESDPISEILQNVMRSTRSLANELGKPAPTIKISDNGFMLKSQYQSDVQDIFTHLMRNSLDHGIESVEERVVANKTQEGEIVVNTTRRDDMVVLSIHDDGKGLPLHKLKAKGLSNGTLDKANANDPLQIAMLIFGSGISTAESVSMVSGRGVGMEAVKQFAKAMGGDISIELQTPTASVNSFAPFKLNLSLPASFFHELADDLVS